MTFEMRRAKNGFILKVTGVDVDEGDSEELVHSENYDDEVECFADFLRTINENYGPSTSRYSAKRIYIAVEPGDKYVAEAAD